MDQEQVQPNEEPQFRILAMYTFVSPLFRGDQLISLQADIERNCRQHHARGCILLAPEGLNGTICYPQNGEHDTLFRYFELEFPGLKTRLSSDSRQVFARVKVKIKSEIVTMGGRHVDPTKQAGEYVKPHDWNHLLNDPDCLIIDARNDFEINVGSFANSINPSTTSFSDFPAWFETNVTAPKSIGMYCTGGIRCEKSTSIARERFPNTPIYHLDGGILAYLEAIPKSESMFFGECFVFDQRVALTHGLKPSSEFTACHACRHPLSLADREHDDYREGLSCSYCVCTVTDKQRQRFEERQRQVDLAHEKGRFHIHDPKENLKVT